MGVRLFVGNLSYSLADPELRAAFADFGVIRAEVVQERQEGRSRGYGFVEVENEDAAAAAIKALDGKELSGRPMRIELALSPRRRGLKERKDVRDPR
ncbi:MAG: RNA recognition motif domain-containing protein [Candidatus Binataceae bacterium]